MSTATKDILRFTRDHKCPICGGSNNDPRGQGVRCHGFVSAEWVHCSREEHAGNAQLNENSQTYAHKLGGPCPCGVEHAPADPAPARPGKGKRTIDTVYRYHDAAGKVVHETVRFKPKGFAQRRPVGNGAYEWSLKGIEPVLYRLPELLAADPAEPVWIVEGEKDADRLASLGLVATTNPMGAGKWRDDYAESLRDRVCYIIPDNDPPEPKYPKGKGRDHARQVAQSLPGKAASVKIVELPGVPEKGDVSDFLATGGTVDHLRELAAKAPEWTPPAGAPNPDSRRPSNPPEAESSASRGATTGTSAPDSKYQVIGGCLCRAVTFRGATSWPALCNFTAKIVEEVVHDDGVEQSRRLVLEGKLATDEQLPQITVGIEEFARGDWPLVRWGSHAVVFAGQGNRDHLRVALQCLSGRAPRRVVYTFTGWCQAGETWVYLHAGGAIGPDGPVGNVSVELPGALENYRLPPPPEGEERIVAVRASLSLADGLAPDKVILPLLATTYGAVLPEITLSTHVSGRTGGGKTELAALMQQHFGPEMSAKRLPASWSSTGNALEALGFAAKDTLLVVDDFCPTGSSADVSRYHKEADRLFRAQGNRSGRQRLRSDGSSRPTKPPRGTILSTGEDVPLGNSLRARMLIVELGRRDLVWGRLKLSQEHAASGLLAQAMAAYLQWLAPRYQQVAGHLKAEASRLRDAIISSTSADQHKRTPTMVAELLSGFSLFLEFAKDVGAIDQDQVADLELRCRQALLKTAAEQASHHEASDPCVRFFDLLRSALSSGRAHVAGPDGGQPSQPSQVWGWRQRDGWNGSDNEWQQQGKCIGWLVGDDLYLDPDAAYAEANRLAGEQGSSLVVTQNTLHRRMSEQGLLASTDPARQKIKVRRTLAGARRQVLHLRATSVLGAEETGPTGPSGPMGQKPAENGPVLWAGSSGGQENRPRKPAQIFRETVAVGPLGPVGPASGALETRRCGGDRESADAGTMSDREICEL